jgi:guanylate kinase
MLNSAVDSERQGFMLVLSSPSGVGKTTVARQVLALEQNIELSISATTRSPRPSEKEGKDYYFISKSKFMELCDEGAFLEHALVYGHHYGTPRAAVEEQLKSGINVVFDIDWQGTQQLKQNKIGDVVSIFLLPPSLSVLKKRLAGRAEDNEDIIHQRMNKAGEELSHWAEYDYVIINENLDQCVQAVRSIIQAECLKRHRQKGLVGFMKTLQETSSCL